MKSCLMFVLVIVGLVGCGGDLNLPDVDCGAVPTPTYAEVTGLDKCNVCHSETAVNRFQAPAKINFDTYEAAAAHAEEAASQVYSGKMPPAGFPGLVLTDQEAQTLYQWALCGAPQ